MVLLKRPMDVNGVVKMPDLDYELEPNGVGYAFFEKMLLNKKKIAQIDAIDNVEDSYGSLLERCIRTAIEMRRRGVTPNDIISICSSNHLNSCVPFIAAFFVGATVASLDPGLSAHDTVHLLKLTKPKLLFISNEAIKLVEDAVEVSEIETELVIFGESSKHTPFLNFLKKTTEEENFSPYLVESLNKTALILFSSGTTGLPKGICISHFAYLGQMEVQIKCTNLHDRVLTFSSLYWISSCLYCGCALLEGLTRIVVPKFDAAQLWKTLDTHKVNTMFISPYLAIQFYKSNRPHNADLSSLREICIGGGPISANDVVNIRQTFPKVHVVVVYGMSETGYITCFPNDFYEKLAVEKPSSCGFPVLGLSYKIIDTDTGKTLGQNQIGEIHLKTAYMLSGYYNMDSSNVWDCDGWLRTGDIGYYDEEYCLYVIDRIKEMLKFQSFHVTPAVIESALMSHPYVKTAFVFGTPHEVDGDHPTGAVVLKDSCNNVNPEDLIKFVDGKVDDRHRLRGGVIIVNDIPMTPSGKVNRRLAKPIILSNLN